MRKPPGVVAVALARAPVAAGAMAAGVGAVVLLGWAFELPRLRSVLPGLVEMKVNTAIAFGLAGASLLLRRGVRARRRAAVACASVVALIGLLTVAEYLLGLDLGIDQLLFREAAGAAATSSPGRMAPTTAACFLLCGLSLRWIDSSEARRRHLAELLVVPVALNSLLVAAGYAYGLHSLVGIAPNMAMAVHTCLAFAALSAGVLLARSDGAFTGLLTADTAGGAAARRFLPVTVVPLAIGWLGRAGMLAGLYDEGLHSALVGIANVAALCGFVWLHARALHHVDLARSRAQRALERANEELEDRIARRTADLAAANEALTREHDRLRASKAALREREVHLATTLNSIGDGVIATDDENRVIRMNPVAERITGWRFQEASARPIAEVFVAVDDETGQLIENPADRALREGVVVTLAKRAALLARDGTRCSVADIAAPIRDAGGEVRGVVLVFRDVRAEREAQKALASAHTQLELSARMASLGTLAAGVGHEINNPLACLIANLDFMASMLLESPGLAPTGRLRELAEVVDEMRDSSSRIRLIVRDLRNFCRVDDGRGPVDLRRVVEWSITMVWNEIRHRARLVKDFGGAPAAQGNEARLGQVVVNLLINAAQAIREGSAEDNEIRIVTRTDERGWSVLEIRDTGCGIAPENQRKVFDPFFTTKDVGVGTGLGLFVCHGIVAELGGELSLESQVGRGTCFRVALPPAPLHASETRRGGTTPAESRPPGRRGRVLIVDDEPLVVAALSRGLAAEHEVFTCTRATDALDRIERGERFDLIMCDLMMPEMTGMDLHSRLSQSRPSEAGRMIFLTGGAFTTEARAFLDRVTNHRMEKPFDLQALRALVRDRLSTTNGLA